MLPFDFLPGHMTNFAAPAAAHLVDTVSGATPLAAAKSRRAGESAVHVPWEYGRNDR